MPRINGVELIRRIHKKDPRIKFILMSAFDLPDVDTNLPMPPYEYVQKPLYVEKIKKLVYKNAN
jgi:two-component SAPR family response regulator